MANSNDQPTTDAVAPAGQPVLTKQHDFSAIHALSQQRTQPMEVLCLGWPRTGTQSLKAALVTLGYKVYHMGDNYMLGHDAYWKMGIDAEADGAGFGEKELDKLLGDYSATADSPTSVLPRALIQTYPDAKIILNSRPASRWRSSMLSTILLARRTYGHDPNDSFQAWLDRTFGNDFEANAEAAFTKHEELVKRLASEMGREVLVWEVGKADGWEKICGFLGKEVPRNGTVGECNGANIMEFPRKDDWAEYKREPRIENLKWLMGEERVKELKDKGLV